MNSLAILLILLIAQKGNAGAVVEHDSFKSKGLMVWGSPATNFQDSFQDSGPFQSPFCKEC